MRKPIKLFSALNTILVAGIVLAISIEVVLLALPQANSTPVSALDAGGAGASDTNAATLAGDVTSQCAIHMTGYMNDQNIKFGEFMTKHFQSKKQASDLIPTAIERFRVYRAQIRNEMNTFLHIDPAKALAAGTAEYNSCKQVVDENFKLIAVMIRSHIQENAVAKKATRLLDKYQEINKKLDTLNFTIGQMAGYFGSLAQRLPCFATKCVKG